MFEPAFDLALVLQLNDLEHGVILLDCFKFLLKFIMFILLDLSHMMVLDPLLFLLELPLEEGSLVLDSGHLVLLSVNLALPVALHPSHLNLLRPQLLLKRVELLLQLPVLLLYLIDVLLQSSPFIVKDGFCLLYLLHIVLHLALEVVFQEVQKVVLDIDLLNLIVNCLELAIHFAVLSQFSQASQLSSHLDQLVLLLIGSVLLALLFDFLQDLGFDQVQLQIDLHQASILFHQQAQNVAGLLG